MIFQTGPSAKSIGISSEHIFEFIPTRQDFQKIGGVHRSFLFFLAIQHRSNDIVDKIVIETFEIDHVHLYEFQ